MIEGLPLPPANATAPHLSDPPIGPRPRHFVRLAHGINVRVARDPITTPALSRLSQKSTPRRNSMWLRDGRGMRPAVAEPAARVGEIARRRLLCSLGRGSKC